MSGGPGLTAKGRQQRAGVLWALATPAAAFSLLCPECGPNGVGVPPVAPPERRQGQVELGRASPVQVCHRLLVTKPSPSDSGGPSPAALSVEWGQSPASSGWGQ